MYLVYLAKNLVFPSPHHSCFIFQNDTFSASYSGSQQIPTEKKLSTFFYVFYSLAEQEPGPLLSLPLSKRPSLQFRFLSRLFLIPLEKSYSVHRHLLWILSFFAHCTLKDLPILTTDFIEYYLRMDISVLMRPEPPGVAQQDGNNTRATAEQLTRSSISDFYVPHFVISVLIRFPSRSLFLGKFIKIDIYAKLKRLDCVCFGIACISMRECGKQEFRDVCQGVMT